ncbi:MAG: metal-sensitive transcriptional regulator [Nannocystaceae bacterium]
MNADEKKRLASRLKRAEGQIAAIRRMVEQEAPCVDLLLQISAVRGALSRAGEMILGSHIETCVTDAFQKGDEETRQTTIDELMDVFARYGGIGGR